MSALSQRSVAAKCWKRMNAVVRSSRLITNSHYRFRSKVEFTRTINSIALTLVLLAAGSPKRINQFFQPITKMDRVGRNEVYWTGAILRAANSVSQCLFLAAPTPHKRESTPTWARIPFFTPSRTPAGATTPPACLVIHSRAGVRVVCMMATTAPWVAVWVLHVYDEH